MARFLDNLLIKHKLIFMSPVALAGIVLLLLLKVAYVGKSERMNQTLRKTLEINNSMLLLRRNEKNFLARNTFK